MVIMLDDERNHVTLVVVLLFLSSCLFITNDRHDVMMNESRMMKCITDVHAMIMMNFPRLTSCESWILSSWSLIMPKVSILSVVSGL